MSQLAERPLPGGPLSVDLLNTTWVGSNGPVDWLDDDQAVDAFVAEHAAPTVADRSAARDELVRAREMIRRLFAESSRGDSTDAVIAEMNKMLQQASVQLAPGDGSWFTIGSNAAESYLATKALIDAAEVLSGQPDRLRQCEHESCVLWFVDVSKAGRRRWCSMDTCGNRAKAQRHYRRNTSPAP